MSRRRTGLAAVPPGRRLRYLRQGLATLLGLAPRGVFLPYGAAESLDPEVGPFCRGGKRIRRPARHVRGGAGRDRRPCRRAAAARPRRATGPAFSRKAGFHRSTPPRPMPWSAATAPAGSSRSAPAIPPVSSPAPSPMAGSTPRSPRSDPRPRADLDRLAVSGDPPTGAAGRAGAVRGAGRRRHAVHRLEPSGRPRQRRRPAVRPGDPGVAGGGF